MKRALFAIFLIALLAGCRQGWLKKERGVQVAENRGAPAWKEGRVRLVEELVVGKEEGSKQELFSSWLSLAVDSQGNIYILDSKKRKIYKFSEDGRLVWEAGKKGKGPGELAYPFSIGLLGDRVGVVDSRRVKLFRCSDGSFVDEIKLPLSVSRWIQLDDGRVLASGMIMGKLGMRLVLLSPSFQEEKAVFSYVMKADLPKQVAAGIGAGFWGGKGEIMVVLPDRYEIRIMNLEGKLLKRILRSDVKLRPPRIEYGGTGKSSWIRVYPSDSMNGVFPLGDRFILVEWKRADKISENKYKIKRFLDLFSREGRFLATLSIPEDMSLQWVDGEGRLYFIRTDPFPAVVRMRLEGI